MKRLLNTPILKQLIKLGVTHYSLAKNYGKPNQDQVSSVHFFTSDVPDDAGGYPEVAYMIPDFVDTFLPERKQTLIGFSKITRTNHFDINLVAYDLPLSEMVL
ncbi:hypothetical protein GD1_221 [Paraglaciecola Antarctic GD virus 1]|nr:hypothetical protein GD1_221 [Paraglaciecola Antarctic GD virus 1]